MAEEDVRALVNALRSEDATVRGAAVAELGRRQDPGAIEPLLIFAVPRKPLLKRWWSILTAPQLGTDKFADEFAAAVRLGFEVRESRDAAWTALGPELTSETIIAVLGDPARPADQREEAARALGLLGGPGAVAALREALDRRGQPGRQRVLRSLAALAPDEATAPARQALREHDDDLRRAGADVLGDAVDRDSVDALITLLRQDDDRHVRRAAATALGKIGDDRAWPALREAMDNDTEGDLDDELSAALVALGGANRPPP